MNDDQTISGVDPAELLSTDPFYSDTLRSLEFSPVKMVPEPKPVCVSCPVSNWFVADGCLGCYCKAMHKYPWAPGRSLPLCDTRKQAREALMKSPAD